MSTSTMREKRGLITPGGLENIIARTMSIKKNHSAYFSKQPCVIWLFMIMFTGVTQDITILNIKVKNFDRTLVRRRGMEYYKF